MKNLKEKNPNRKLHLASERQCALLLLHVFDERNARREAKNLKPMTRAKLTSSMLKELWGRQRLSSEFIQEVADWMLIAGWVLFFAGPFYAAVQVAAVKNWPRVSTDKIKGTLAEVADGTCDFDSLEFLLFEKVAIGREGVDSEVEGGDEE